MSDTLGPNDAADPDNAATAPQNESAPQNEPAPPSRVEPLPPLDPSIASTQLSELNQRVRMHASRLWQLPFAYVGFTALMLTNLDKVETVFQSFLYSSFLVLVGLVVVWCMLGAYEGVARGGREIANVEVQVGLRRTVTAEVDWLERFATRPNRLTSHFVPYFVLVIVAWVGAICLPFASTTKQKVPPTQEGTQDPSTIPKQTPPIEPSGASDPAIAPAGDPQGQLDEKRTPEPRATQPSGKEGVGALGGEPSQETPRSDIPD